MYADATQIAADKSRQELDEISGIIIGAAQRVQSAMGIGFLERVYENALCLELEIPKLRVEQQKPVRVYYKTSVVGEYVTDLIVQQAIVVEVKAVEALDWSHRAQCINYLRATGHRVGLLLNFGRPRLEFRRFVNGY